MPQEQKRLERKMGDARRGRNQVGEKRQVRVRLEELCAERKQLRMQNLFDPRQVNFGIFDPGMIAMNQQGSECERQDYDDRF